MFEGMVHMSRNYITEVNDINIGPLQLESGATIPSVSLRYERVGPVGAPVVLICHALTGNHVTIGNNEEPGWWSGLIGHRLAIDTTKYQVITFNVLGGCNGSTGPLSINPNNNRPYGKNFPNITIRDIVHAQYLALKRLQVDEVFAVVGGSLGGMQVLEWGLLYSNIVNRLIALAVTPTLSDYGIAYNYISEQSIISDPAWNNGDYNSPSEIRGLEIARMIGMVTYRSAELFHERFGRAESSDGFSVTSYLKYQGEKLASRFDPNSYLTLLQAMNSHDIGRDRGGWKEACKKYTCPILAISYEYDLIYDPNSIAEFASHTPNATYHHVSTKFGHDGFLTEFEKWSWMVQQFLES
ncbi:homoserine O-acetyltransferase [Ornithinibacillus halotolerans]|uniref:Homoserine O-acetyltransferase n=2 Tax=Ornithinibacillus halotolerans TaxID=1274357 RepID=A0A916RN68_9BACI|nr:homoserine O-acetyltransferase [Ornithinibacillus halotolerans]